MIQILKLAVSKGASDIHLTANSPPLLRVDGSLFKVNSPELSSEDVKKLCYSVISDDQKATFETEKNLDFSFFIKKLARFRGALFFQKASVTGVFRLLHNEAPDLKDLGLPPVMEDITNFPHGLVLMTGPTGSGKSTTLAAITNVLNENRRAHILTIEDPIEIVHPHKNSIVNQREIGVDCRNFQDGLKNALRSDPDICFIGEMRDKSTIESALKLAETGHLVFSTLHTNTAAKTIDRLIGVFNPEDRTLIQNQLSTVLQAVVSQRLIPGVDGGRKVAIEVMMVNPAIRNLIREGKVFQIYSVMQTNFDQGTITMNRSLLELIQKGEVSPEEAFKVTSQKDELLELLKRYKIAS